MNLEDQRNLTRIVVADTLKKWRAQGKLGQRGPEGPPGKDAVLDDAKLEELVQKKAEAYLLKRRSLFKGKDGLQTGQILRTTQQVSGGGEVPVGGVIMWSGTIADATALSPTWGLCDGTANAPGPDLRDKFIVGARQDSGGVAKTNVEGSLKQSGGVTGVSHSAHANLTHTGGAVGDHTGLTHGLTIANHPDLTHAAVTFGAHTLTHGDHAIASFSGNIPSRADLSVPTGSIASRADLSRPTGSIASHNAGSVPAQTASLTLQGWAASFATSTNRSGANTSTNTVAIASAANASGPTRSFASGADVSMPTLSIASANNASMPALTHSHAASTLTHADHSVASSTHALNSHVGTDYGVHTFTAPAAHGTAGTLTHSFTQPSDHSISAHDTVLSLPVYYALAFLQRMQ